MDESSRWSLFFKDNNFPCFITDTKKNTILYANDEFLKLFSLEHNILGEKFYQVIPLEADLFKNSKLELNKIYKNEISYKNSAEKFYASTTLIDSGNAIFCKLETNDSGDLSKNFNNVMIECMNIYQQPSETILSSFMKLLCNFYESERAYIYRLNQDKNTVRCISQWSENNEYIIEKEVGQELKTNIFAELVLTSENNAFLTASKTDADFNVNSPLGEIIERFNIENLTLTTVEDANNNVIGLVGISNRKKYDNFFDRRLLQAVSRLVTQSVTRGIMDDEVMKLYYKDALTGLFNRVGYSKQMDELLKSPPKNIGIISVNINGLKHINKNMGIAGGDNHIKKSASFLKSYFGYTFFRMSGDEFIGIASDVLKEEFEEKVEKLHQKMQKESNYDFSVGHSFGTGSYDISKLILEADTVMYINKQEYYSATQRHFDSVNDTTLSDLLSYLENDEFMVYLQPQVLLEDGSLYGAEALIRRFDKKNQKMVFPDQFIPLYEQKSIIRHVDIFVIESVCKLLNEWGEKAIPVSVNLSRVTLLEYGIVDTIVEICDKFNVPHNLLVIEVTERVGLIENNVASSLIEEFKENGFNISLDDFGCAYSNIVTLAQIEVDEVKIDKSLVDYIVTSKKNCVLVKNVIAMCNELDGASTLAEGIENEEQARLLYSLGCHIGQGYFYSRPIPVGEFCEKYLIA